MPLSGWLSSGSFSSDPSSRRLLAEPWLLPFVQLPDYLFRQEALLRKLPTYRLVFLRCDFGRLICLIHQPLRSLCRKVPRNILVLLRCDFSRLVYFFRQPLRLLRCDFSAYGLIMLFHNRSSLHLFFWPPCLFRRSFSINRFGVIFYLWPSVVWSFTCGPLFISAWLLFRSKSRLSLILYQSSKSEDWIERLRRSDILTR